MVAPAFGFSVGDFIAAIGLVKKTTKALREVDGASTQFQLTILDLELLERVLTSVQGLDPHLDWSPAKQPSKTEKVFRAGRRVQWTVAVEQDVKDLRAQIGPQLAAISLLLQLEQLEQDNLRQARGASMQEMLEQVQRQVTQLASYTQTKVSTQQSHQAMMDGLHDLADRMSSVAQQQDLQKIASSSKDTSLRVKSAATTSQVDALGTALDRLRMQGVAIHSSLTQIKETTERSQALLEGIASLLRQTADAKSDLPKSLVESTGAVVRIEAETRPKNPAPRLEGPTAFNDLVKNFAPMLMAFALLANYLQQTASTLGAVVPDRATYPGVHERNKSPPGSDYRRSDTVYPWLQNELQDSAVGNSVELKRPWQSESSKPRPLQIGQQIAPSPPANSLNEVSTQAHHGERRPAPSNKVPVVMATFPPTQSSLSASQDARVRPNHPITSKRPSKKVGGSRDRIWLYCRCRQVYEPLYLRCPVAAQWKVDHCVVFSKAERDSKFDQPSVTSQNVFTAFYPLEHHIDCKVISGDD